jgi:uncharacterized integral membrane protein
MKRIRRRLDPSLLRLVAAGVLLTLLSFFVVQNSVVINVRLAYFSGTLDEIEMRLGTALILAGVIGFGIGWLLASWRR